MTAKRKVSVFTLSDAIASSIQGTIPPAQMAKLDGAQSQKILQAVAQCAGQVIAALEPTSE
jgi:hypothetical protein|tara:strand:- start:195 stop:377 length:183 start_codon:yes stop_codon:yes gene_type:complete